jgi:peptidase M23-like protein
MPAARRRLAAAAFLAAATAAAPADASWRLPVEAPVTRAFDLGADPFEGGRHRGVDLAARTGAPVRAPCAGEVVVAGRVGTSGRVVTLRCGLWRVSHMPLGAIAVRRHERVEPGTTIGTAARSREHAGLHLGVRREGDRFGYVDPLGFLEAKRAPPPLVAGRRPRPTRVTRPPRLGPAPRASRPAPNRLRRAAPVNVGRSAPAVIAAGRAEWVAPAPGVTASGRTESAASASEHSKRAPVPWPAWVGAALILAGVGVGRRVPLRVRGGIARGRPVEGIR